MASDPAPDSACRGLDYTAAGPTRTAYLPCAGEIIRSLETLDSVTTAILNGEEGKRAEGRGHLRRVNALMRSAGGRKLFDRWEDRGLMDLNVDMHNAVVHYQAFYMLPIKSEPHPFAAKTREAAAAEALGGTRNYREALQAYRQLGGR
jgi:hypothetical protein